MIKADEEDVMRTFFFGDIHGNIPALEECLRHMDSLRVDEVYCLGDIVGWLPFGDRTLKRMLSLGIPTVAGNHDLLVAGLFTDRPDQSDRRQATAYNAGLLSAMEGATDFLLSLPLVLDRERFIVVHHSPFHLPPAGRKPTIDCFDYLNERALRSSLGPWSTGPHRLIFSGHDHIPAVYELPDSAQPPRLEDIRIHRPPAERPHTIRLSQASRYWIKAGSVGGPYRDGVSVANSVLYDSAEEAITLFRLPYRAEELCRELVSNRFYMNLDTMRRYVDLAGGE